VLSVKPHTAGDRTPYTYVIWCLLTGKRYYGVAFRKNCHPNDLWVRYFTSCQAVKYDLKVYGAGAFRVEIRRIFDCPNKARDWEKRVLQRLKIPNLKWYNKSVSAAPESKAGILNPMYGKHFSLESRAKISARLKGKPHSVEHTAKVADGHRGKKLSESHSETLHTSWQGSHHSRESKEKISLKRKRYWANRCLVLAF
jgi:hypothetical protein